MQSQLKDGDIVRVVGQGSGWPANWRNTLHIGRLLKVEAESGTNLVRIKSLVPGVKVNPDGRDWARLEKKFLEKL
jgi:hypothetical protein